MSPSYLLVPMHLDAMVLNQNVADKTSFLRFQMDYSQLQAFDTAEPPPFGGASTTPPAPGIYLHWTLPDALRQGQQSAEGSTSFPLIPNRWLIARIWDDSAAGPQVKAWVIESDFLDPADGTSPFVDLAGLTPEGAPTPTLIGRALRFTPALASLAPAPGQPAAFLTARGPGSLIFAAFSPGVQNVLAFYDDMTADDDTTAIDKAELSYLVAGWHADPAADPLATTTWAPSGDPALAGAYANSAFNWLLYADAAELPTQALVHALLASVPWDTSQANAPAQNFPSDIQGSVKVAVGNTAIDALAAIVRLSQGSQTEADMLEAFQYGLLDLFDQPGSSEALSMAIRQRWYSGSPGGTLWVVVGAERTGSTAVPGTSAPSLSPQQLAALAALNAAQRELDRQQRILESMQWNLFGLWWKAQRQVYAPPPVGDALVSWLAAQLPLQVGQGAACNSASGTNPSQEDWYLCKVLAQQRLVSQAQGQQAAAQTALDKLLDPTVFTLKATNLPQYSAPNDPVVLIAGMGRSTNFDPTGGVICRLAGQAVAALTIGGTRYSADGSGGTDIRPKLPALADPNALLPAGVQELLVESVFLSPDLFAQLILGDPSQAGAVRQALAALPHPAVNTSFAPPSYAMPEWQQPWVPLLLDWQVTVFTQPAYSAAADPSNPHQGCSFNQANWQFDGTNYDWVGPTTAQGSDFSQADAQMVLQGRTFITPYLPLTLANQLDQYVQQHQLRDPSLEQLLKNLDSYIDTIGNQDILSQRLSGLLAGMAQRDYRANVSPSGALAGAVGDWRHGYPMPFPDRQVNFGSPIFDFAPLCGTFFVIDQLTVIDTFGRTVDVMLANGSTAPLSAGDDEETYFYPIAGNNLRGPTTKDPVPYPGQAADATPRMLQLAPQPIQDAQLAFELVSNDGQNSDITLVGGANPVCGWLVPNHLDRSLALYAPDGSAWGELYLAERAPNQYTPAWQPDPTNPSAPQSVDAIPNGYVRAIFQALTARADNGAGFAAFIQAIDATLWTINPLGQRKDQNLSVLVGRPLAIVRAELSLRLRGLSLASQDWWNTFDVDPASPPGDGTQPAPVGAFDGGITANLWPVRLGSQALRDDGLVGYFADDPQSPGASFATFNCVTLPAAVESPYLRQIGQPGSYPQLRFVDDSVAAPDPAQNQSCGLTMLLDPRGSVHAFSGLLPVVTLELPSAFVGPALQNMAYLFRAGPFLTSPDAVRIPRPAERNGTWQWFDKVLNATAALAQADGNTRLPITPPLIKEGWLKFTPNAPEQDESE